MNTIDRRIIKSQQAIQSTFLEMVVTDGFDKITVIDITERANIGRKTFYLHYLDKFDLLDNILDDHIAQLKVLCDQKKDLGMLEGALLWFSYFEQHQLLFAALFQSKGASSFRERLLAFTMGEIGTKIHPDSEALVDRHMFLKFLGTATVGVLEAYILGELDRDMEVVAKQLIHLYILNINSTFPQQPAVTI